MIYKYYKLLDLPVGASQDEIKKAYRNKAKDFHPDVNTSPQSTAKFQEIHTAYIYLTNNPAPTDLGLKQPKYQYTPKAPTDPKEYSWWYQETVKRSKERAEDKKELTPEYIQFQRKQRELARLLGRTMLILLGMPIAFFLSFLISDLLLITGELSFGLWIICATLFTFSAALFVKGIIRGLKPPIKTKN